jgi:predicted DNA-binding transcriptional regulator YafY
VANWSFLTNHARALLCIADDPGVRLRDIAARVGITERTAYGIVADLTAAGYVVKRKDGRRNRYQIQTHMPLREPTSQEPAIGEVLALLAGASTTQHATVREPARGTAPSAEAASLDYRDRGGILTTSATLSSEDFPPLKASAAC